MTQNDSISISVEVPSVVADDRTAERARILLVLDAVRTERLSWRAAARVLGLSPAEFLELAADHDVPVVRYDVGRLADRSCNARTPLPPRPRRQMIVVADMSPMLHLARMALIHHVVGRVTAPRTVWEELTASRSGQVSEAIDEADWIDVVDDPPLQDLGLDPGETAAILLAEALSAEALLIDERHGRVVAQSRGIPVIGTLGIVAGARRRGFIHQAAPVLAALRADGFWLSDALVKEFLKSLGELT